MKAETAADQLGINREHPADDKELLAVVRTKEGMASIIAGVSQAVQTTIYSKEQIGGKT